MNRKLKIILLIILILITGYIIFRLIFYTCCAPNPKPALIHSRINDTKDQRLADPDLLYASMNWAGLCVNEKQERGGCYGELYLYSDGDFIKKVGFIKYDEENGGEENPGVRKQLSSDSIEQVEKIISDSVVMQKDCPPQDIMDAGWDYQINFDGVKKSFHNPPKECLDIFNQIDEKINFAIPDSSSYEISNTQNEGDLGNHTCISKFQVKRSDEYLGGEEILDLDFFQSFGSGAFYGKIKDYKPELNKKFAAFINQLMREKEIMTYLHLEADICLYNQDLFNPENGATLNYYIEHFYCTNSCQTGKYEIKVDLDTNGNFVGYRQQTDNIY